MEEHKGKGDQSLQKEFFVEIKFSIRAQPSSKGIDLLSIRISRFIYACFLICDILDGCLILMHEIKVLDLRIGFFAFWIFDPCIKWVKKF